MLIIGIGNPGEKYIKTRHNIGLTIAKELLQFDEITKTHKILLSTDYMNNSGSFVQNTMKFYKLNPTDIIIIHDDLDLNNGEFKLHFARGPKAHNGINDIEQKLKTKDFWRLRIGVNEDRHNQAPKDFVLSKFESKIELKNIIEAISKMKI